MAGEFENGEFVNIENMNQNQILRAVNGKPISSADMEGFAQIMGSRGTGVQFFYSNVFYGKV